MWMIHKMSRRVWNCRRVLEDDLGFDLTYRSSTVEIFYRLF